MGSRACAVAVAAVLTLAGPGSRAQVRGAAAAAARVEAVARDPAALADLVGDTTPAPAVRARALLALGRLWAGPLESEARLLLARSLEDPSPRVRRAAVRVVGELGERPLERTVLKRVAEDPDPGVRCEALAAVERWTRPTHLYYLEAALGFGDPGVRAQALRNLGRLGVRDLRPDLVATARTALRRGSPAERAAALGALRAWDRLGDEDLADLLQDPGAPEFLVLQALEAARGREGVVEAVADRLARSRGLRTAWAAFTWLRQEAPGHGRVAPAVARIVDGETRRNRALFEMAAYLKGEGYRVEQTPSGWRVLGKGP